MNNYQIVDEPNFTVVSGDFPRYSRIELTPLKVNLLLPDWIQGIL